jgi:hypothetical protein
MSPDRPSHPIRVLRTRLVFGIALSGALGLASDAYAVPADTDGDGLFDADELARGLDPGRVDSDGDGLCDGAVAVWPGCVGVEDPDGDGLVGVGESDPLSPDTDGDGVCDGPLATVGTCVPWVDPAALACDGTGFAASSAPGIAPTALPATAILGFDPVRRVLWAVEAGADPRVYRQGATSTSLVGSLVGLSPAQAGDVGPDGRLVLLSGDTVSFVTPESVTVDWTLQLSAPPGDMADLAVHPSGEVAWGVRSNGEVTRIDLVSGAVAVAGTLSVDSVAGVYFDPFERLVVVGEAEGTGTRWSVVPTPFAVEVLDTDPAFGALGTAGIASCVGRDSDLDGVRDSLDLDDDGDGWFDSVEYGPMSGLDPNGDHDIDGVPDWQDPAAPGFVDVGLDGVDDRYDPDGDGIPTHLDPDGDGDGVADGVEHGMGLDPWVADTDGDGWDDGFELAYGTDPLDRDSDDDGMMDGVEPGSSPLSFDTDADGLPDGVERGVVVPVPAGTSLVAAVPVAGTDLAVWVADADPTSETDPGRADTDGDGRSDGLEDLDGDGRFDGDQPGLASDETDPTVPDTDGDGVLDGDEAMADDDGDGVVDGLDPDPPLFGDADGDGLTNGYEAVIGTDPWLPDTDGDGLSDTFELLGPDGIDRTGDELDPTDADLDDDGLSDGEELFGPDGQPGGGDGSAPDVWDSDFDGLSDGVERGVTAGVPDGFSAVAGVAVSGTDPAVLAVDLDPSTTTDPMNMDSDGDGLSDGFEDADRDGMWTATIGGTGTSGAGETDPTRADTDGDGLNDAAENAVGANPLDIDSDDGGTYDGQELFDGTDPFFAGDDVRPGEDSDGDGLDDDQEVVGRDGIANTGDETDPRNADTDEDGLWDGVEVGHPMFDQDPETTTDPNDPDTDGDGLLDGEEDANANGRWVASLGGTGTRGAGETDPLNPDTDGDGVRDGDELDRGIDPLDVDSDDGSVDDGAEVEAGTDPTDASDDAVRRDNETPVEPPGGCSTVSAGAMSGWGLFGAVLLGLSRRRWR